MSIIDKLGITPGPWSKTKDLHDPDVCIYDSKNNWLANVGGGEIVNDDEDPISHANAQLIATAPEMFLVIKGMLDCAETNSMHKAAMLLELMKEVIKKATGKTREEIKELL